MRVQIIAGRSGVKVVVGQREQVVVTEAEARAHATDQAYNLEAAKRAARTALWMMEEAKERSPEGHSFEVDRYARQCLDWFAGLPYAEQYPAISPALQDFRDGLTPIAEAIAPQS